MRKSDRCHNRSLGETNVNFFCRVNKAKSKQTKNRYEISLFHGPCIFAEGDRSKMRDCSELCGHQTLKMNPLALCVTQKGLKTNEVQKL